jgi:hypothetical protein
MASTKTAWEVWNTRNGVSVRVVKREKGKFVTNVSAKQIVKA